MDLFGEEEKKEEEKKALKILKKSNKPLSKNQQLFNNLVKKNRKF